MSDALTHILPLLKTYGRGKLLPLLKTYGRGKLRDFAGNVVSEMDENKGVGKSLKAASMKTARSVLRDLTGRGVRRVIKRKTTKKKTPRKKKKVVRRRVKSDFFDNE